MENESPVSEFHFNFKRMGVALGVVLVIVVIHILRLGSYLSGSLFIFYYSFFSDIVIPIAIYFLLCINDITLPFLRSWLIKAMLVLLLASASEIAQGFGIPLLGNTFDFLDFVMFFIGTMIAVGMDKLFSKVFSFWSFGVERALER
jgi:hypothetical protein